MTQFVTTFAESTATLLRSRRAELAARWYARAVAATPRQSFEHTGASEAVVEAIVGALERDARWQGEVMRLAWDAGARAYDDGLSVHHVLKDAELLLAILLSAVEDAVRGGQLPLALPAPSGASAAGESGGRPASSSDLAGVVADVVAVTRRLQRAASLYSHASASRYLHAVVTTMRDRWRILRHDLRNPLGTIQSALSLMEDETLSLEMRTGPRIRAMVSRNAGSLETLIAEQLHDDVAESMVAVPQDVSLRDVALAVRRTLREATQLASCEVEVDDGLGAARVDEAAVELTLTALLLAAIACAGAGDLLRVEQIEQIEGGETVGPHHNGDTPHRRRIVLRVARLPRQSDVIVDGTDALGTLGEPLWDAGCQTLAASLAEEYGGTVTDDGDSARLLTLPIVPLGSSPGHPSPAKAPAALPRPL